MMKSVPHNLDISMGGNTFLLDREDVSNLYVLANDCRLVDLSGLY